MAVGLAALLVGRRRHVLGDVQGGMGRGGEVGLELLLIQPL